MRDSDATLVLTSEQGTKVSIGTERALQWARQHGKPILVVNLSDTQAVARAEAWVLAQRRRFGGAMILGIGGPRESEAPGIYDLARGFLAAFFDRVPSTRDPDGPI